MDNDKNRNSTLNSPSKEGEPLIITPIVYQDRIVIRVNHHLDGSYECVTVGHERTFPAKTESSKPTKGPVPIGDILIALGAGHLFVAEDLRDNARRMAKAQEQAANEKVLTVPGAIEA